MPITFNGPVTISSRGFFTGRQDYTTWSRRNLKKAKWYDQRELAAINRQLELTAQSANGTNDVNNAGTSIKSAGDLHSAATPLPNNTAAAVNAFPSSHVEIKSDGTGHEVA
ncbi:hypothetical protein CSUB01_04987 [Colletotrichum sublineola]|uniref:Uncharacterized protein n=1 Tax=Colletotrichum sublineola TaxID=1173701 RepID=A0A066XDT7_COLSU|nr:hypothetical protein CSUB01_04987 [Colletotrichum sublineola]